MSAVGITVGFMSLVERVGSDIVWTRLGERGLLILIDVESIRE